MKTIFSLLFVLVFYSSISSSDDFDCNDAETTMQINHCARIALTEAQLEMNVYLRASKEHNNDDFELIKSIDIAQEAWGTYAEAHCNSIYTKWREGTIRGVMSLGCKTNITKQRTHEIWLNFLTYMDSTSPVLPEPMH